MSIVMMTFNLVGISGDNEHECPGPTCATSEPLSDVVKSGERLAGAFARHSLSGDMSQSVVLLFVRLVPASSCH